MPGIGPIVADGPLAAGLGEAAGHLAGGVAGTLETAGLSAGAAKEWETRIAAGDFLVGAHVQQPQVTGARDVMRQAGGQEVRWVVARLTPAEVSVLQLRRAGGSERMNSRHRGGRQVPQPA